LSKKTGLIAITHFRKSGSIPEPVNVINDAAMRNNHPLACRLILKYK